MATLTVSTRFYTAAGAPLVSPATAPTFSQVRKDTDVQVASGSMSESANAPGVFWVDLTTVDGLEYLIVLDGDPIAAGQTAAGPPRFAIGHISGTSEERQRVDIAAILVDTGTTLPAEHALLETEAAAAAREATNTAEHGTTLTAVGLNETEIAAAARAVTNQTEHDATQVAIAAIPAAPTVGAIADQVWDEPITGHTAAGTMGEKQAIDCYEGAIYVDPAAANTGTVIGVDGLPSNPVSTEAAARTLMTATGLKVCRIYPDPAFGVFTLTQDWSGLTIEGIAQDAGGVMASVDLNGQTCYQTQLVGCFIVGWCDNPTSFPSLQRCQLGMAVNTEVALALMDECYLGGAIRMAGCAISRSNFLSTCVLRPTLVYPMADNALDGCYGQIFFADLATNVWRLYDFRGQVELNATNTGGTVELNGIGELIDNSAGTTINQAGFVQPVSTDLDVDELLGLAGKNKVVRIDTKNPAGLPLTQTVRIYDTEANALVDDGATGLVHEYSVTDVLTGNSLDKHTQTRP